MGDEEAPAKDGKIDIEMLNQRETNLLDDIREARHYYSRSARNARRSFQFDMRWVTCVQAREQLRQLCDLYLDGKAGLLGNDFERHRRLEELRVRTYEIRAQEEAGFFKRLTARMEGEKK